jgi:phosphoglycerate dehydrogenase-like enzyme
VTFTIVTTGNADPHLELLPELEARGCRLIVLPEGARWDEARIAELAPVADAYVGMFRGIGLPRAVLERSPRLRGIVSPIIGVENIDVAAATELGLVVAHGAMPENFDGMAEAGVMLIAALLKELPQKQAVLAAGQWRPTPVGRMVQGATVGIIGLGRIGRGVAERLAGWGTRLIAHDPYVAPGSVADVEMRTLDELLREADVVVMLVTLSDETRHLIDGRALSLMKPGSFLINIGRGGCVDEAALLKAIEAGHIAGAGIDTWETEPLPPGNPLRAHPNVIATGHCVGHSRELYTRAPQVAVENVWAVLNGHDPLHVRNPEVLERWRERVAALG